MIKKYIPKRGDLIHIDLDPTKGQEIKGERYAIVTTPYSFNKLGFIWACPISLGIGDSAVRKSEEEDNLKLTVSLMNSDSSISGRIFVHQHQSLDWRVRNLKFIEEAPRDILDEVLSIIDAILYSDE